MTMALANKSTEADELARLYQLDYARWLLENARLLREGRLTEADTSNIAEELEDMGRSEARALRSHLRVLLTHLLKWQFQPDQRSSSWRGSIFNARKSAQRLLKESPSLRGRIPELVADIYGDAVFNAANETGLAETSFPTTCPYKLEDMLDTDHWPG
jgi:hypothetical protein